MSADSEPRIPPLTKADFEQLDLNKIKPEGGERGIDGYICSLVARSTELKQAGKIAPAAAAQMILDICGYGFTPSNSMQPYSPRMVFSGKRTAMPDDIPPDLAAILAEIAPGISNPELKARLGDIALLRSSKRRKELAETVAESYLACAATAASEGRWDQAHAFFRRALDIGKRLSPTLKQRLQTSLEQFFDAHLEKADEWMAISLLDWLAEESKALPARIEDLARRLVSRTNGNTKWPLNRRCLLRLASALEQQGRADDARAVLLQAAETHFKSAEDQLKRGEYGLVPAATELSHAVAAHRRISRRSSRADELERREQDIRAQAVDAARKRSEFDPCQQLRQKQASERIASWQQAAQEAAAMARNLEAVESIRFLVLCSPPPRRDKFEEKAIEDLKHSAFSAVLTRTLFDENGNAFAKAGSYLHENPKGQAKVIESRMLGYFKANHIVETTIIFEAVREQILLERQILPDDLIPVIQNSPFVPPGREIFFMQGLLAGFRGDFITAGHMLAPQLEEAIRYTLEIRGVPAYSTEEGETKRPATLNELYNARRAEIEVVFGRDEAFEIEALLIRRWGCNLRNDIAHGRLWPSQFFDPAVRYLWWLTLRLTLFGPPPLPKPWDMPSASAAENPKQTSG